uniref:Uncharacterized protein n=1 Tax=Rhizophora mucronata TaxID=61149 RepID=A0A2P2J393_RHIMU
MPLHFRCQSISISLILPVSDSVPFRGC